VCPYRLEPAGHFAAGEADAAPGALQEPAASIARSATKHFTIGDWNQRGRRRGKGQHQTDEKDLLTNASHGLPTYRPPLHRPAHNGALIRAIRAGQSQK